MINLTSIMLPSPSNLQIWWKGEFGVESFIVDFKNESKASIWKAAIEQQIKVCKEKPEQDAVPPLSEFAGLRDISNPISNLYKQISEDDDEGHISTIPKSAITIVPPKKVRSRLYR